MASIPVSRNLRLYIVEADAIVMTHYTLMAPAQDILKLPVNPEGTKADPSITAGRLHEFSVKQAYRLRLSLDAGLLLPYR